MGCFLSKPLAPENTETGDADLEGLRYLDVDEINTWKGPIIHYREEARVKSTVATCGGLDTQPDPRFVHITALMSKMFNVPVALVTLLGVKECYFKSNHGPLDLASRTRSATLCDAVTVPTVPTVVVVEDASQDARFSANLAVATEPFVRFYAGAPLVGSDGERIGTLCIVDFRPRKFATGLYNTLMNFAELVVRDLERGKIQELRARHVDQAKKLLRTADAFSQAVALVDVENLKTCPVLYVNNVWADFALSSVDDCVGQSLWNVYDITAPEELALLQGAITNGEAVELHVVAKVKGAVGRPMVLTMKPASLAALESGVPVGIPSYISPADLATSSSANTTQTLWFAIVQHRVKKRPSTGAKENKATTKPYTNGSSARTHEELKEIVEQSKLPADQIAAYTSVAASQAASSRVNSGAMASRQGSLEEELSAHGGQNFQAGPRYSGLLKPPKVFGSLHLGALIGSSSFSRVYRGNLKGKLVAVKVLDHLTPTQSTSVTKLLFKALSHPNLLPITHFASDENDPTMLWIIEKYCNEGALNEACDRGYFRLEKSPDAPANMKFVLETALEIAEALKYLHSHNVVHGELNGSNVLLFSDEKQAAVEDEDNVVEPNKRTRRFSALVTDAALNNVLKGDVAGQDPEEKVSHMAPELLSNGAISPACDVYSFGVILWELYNGIRAWCGRHPAQVAFLVSSGQAKLPFPDAAPEEYIQLTQNCLAFDATQRPSAAELCTILKQMIEKNAKLGA